MSTIVNCAGEIFDESLSLRPLVNFVRVALGSATLESLVVLVEFVGLIAGGAGGNPHQIHPQEARQGKGKTRDRLRSHALLLKGAVALQVRGSLLLSFDDIVRTFPKSDLRPVNEM